MDFVLDAGCVIQRMCFSLHHFSLSVTHSLVSFCLICLQNEKKTIFVPMSSFALIQFNFQFKGITLANLDFANVLLIERTRERKKRKKGEWCA